MGDPQIFIVHVWSARGTGSAFRATARAVQQAEGVAFRQADALARFLAGAAAAAPAPGRAPASANTTDREAS